MPIDVILLAVGLAFIYFVILRPMRKQAIAQQTMRSNLTEGARVALTSGIHGTVLHLGQRQAIVEIAPGVEVTLDKNAIVTIVKPEDEEFEYEDEVAEGSGLGATAPIETQADPAPATDQPTGDMDQTTTGPDTNRGL